jgi:hypothetical protein
VFFALMIAGLAASLPGTLISGLQQHGISHAAALQAAAVPPVSTLFSAMLGVNPIAHLLGTGTLNALSGAACRTIRMLDLQT